MLTVVVAHGCCGQGVEWAPWGGDLCWGPGAFDPEMLGAPDPEKLGAPDPEKPGAPEPEKLVALKAGRGGT